MKVVAGNRRSGRTTYLIIMANAFDGLIVCHNSMGCAHVSATARAMGLKIRQPMAFNEFINGAARGSNCKILIDNIELCLENMSGTQVDTVSCLSSETIVLSPDQRNVY